MYRLMVVQLVVVTTFGHAFGQGPVIRRHGTSLLASAVSVEGAALGHTAQLLGGAGDVDDEVGEVCDRLTDLLRQLGSSPKDLVKLNLYAADDETATAAIRLLRGWFPPNARPALSVVVTTLPDGRRLAVDAVFVVRDAADSANVAHHPGGACERRARVSVLPKGDAVYISGQAQPGKDLAAATRATLEGLHNTLTWLKLDRSSVVRVKCFLAPMSQVDVVNREIARYFGDATIPAVSHVEWIPGSEARPVEIEIVAAAPVTDTTDTISYHTPPGMKKSGVFSRVARIHGSRRVYVSGLIPQNAEEPGEQVHSVFQQLIRQLKPARSNLRHLAKATYYVAAGDVSSQLNRIRPHYYDAERPPAASKAMVRGTGFGGRTISVDLIAAPEGPLVSVLTPLARRLKPTRRVAYRKIGDRELHLHVFEPDGHRATDRRPVFLAIHGGGWTGGNAEGFYPFAAHFAEQGMIGVSLEYRLHRPEGSTVFDCVEDARSAVRWIRSNAERLGADASRITAMGGSAGGHLAVSTALFDRVNAPTDPRAVSARPDALVLMYPVIDTSADGYGQAKIGTRWRELSPVHNVRGGLPPALILHGTADAVTPYVGAETFHQRSVDAGNKSVLITHPGGRHGYIIFDPSEFERALAQMSDFLTQHGMLPAR